MGRDPRLALRFDALAVSYRAKIADLPMRMVTDLVRKAQHELGDDDLLTRAIEGFAGQYLDHRHDGEKLFELGRDLQAFIESMNRPDPPDLHRRDIYG